MIQWKVFHYTRTLKWFEMTSNNPRVSEPMQSRFLNYISLIHSTSEVESLKMSHWNNEIFRNTSATVIVICKAEVLLFQFSSFFFGTLNM